MHLTPAEIRLAQYGQRTSTWSTATYNDGTEKALHEIALGLKAEVDRLRAELAEEKAAHDPRLRGLLVKSAPDKDLYPSTSSRTAASRPSLAASTISRH
ncbi:hypothetical protein, partial [Streptomyces longwoodensis]|uniref:hypothetical protein n=1 Tax=Streptomyces longwoodensis TaxID=68231 RepID=UPI0033E60623